MVCSTPKPAQGPDSLSCEWMGGTTVHNISLPVSQADSPFSQVIIDLDQAAGGETQTTPCCPIPSSNRLVSATQMARVMPSTSSATCTPSTSTVKAQTKKKIHKKMKRQRQETPEDREDENDLFNNWLESSMSKNKAKEKWCESEIVKNKTKLELAELQKKTPQASNTTPEALNGLGESWI